MLGAIVEYGGLPRSFLALLVEDDGGVLDLGRGLLRLGNGIYAGRCFERVVIHARKVIYRRIRTIDPVLSCIVPDFFVISVRFCQYHSGVML